MNKTMKCYMNALVILSAIGVVFFCFEGGISGNDFWWHIKTGEWICNNYQIPTHDVFSWYGVQNGLEWETHEWLSQVIFWQVFKYFGEVGIYLLSLLLAISMTGLLFRKMRTHLYLNPVVVSLFLVEYAVLTSLFFYGRPHVFSYFLLYAELECLCAFWKEKKVYMLCFIPFISILWSNLHGGSAILCYGLCIIMLVGGLFKIECGRIHSSKWDKKQIIQLSSVTVASALGVMVNPMGFKAFIYPYWNVTNNLMSRVISEWAAPDMKDIGHMVLYFLPAFVAMFGMLFSKKDIELIDVLYVFFFLFIFLRSVRFIALLYIGFSFFAIPYVMECKVKEIKAKSEHLAVWVIMLGLILFSSSSIIEMSKLIDSKKIIGRVLEDEMIEAVKKYAPQRLYNDYNLGESLIYHEIPVFFDARADVYIRHDVFADGLTLMLLQNVGDKVEDKGTIDIEILINKYGFDAMLILTERPLYSYLLSHPEKYELIYETEQTAFYKVK